MKKVKEILRKKENIFILLLIIISLIGVTLCVFLSDNDELWNFQNVYKMYNGFEIYKDANVICTPLFFYIGKLIFQILGANFFIFRIYSIVIFTFYYFMTYKILRILGINVKVSMLCTLILIMFGNYVLPRVMANYNSLAIGICLLGIYLLLKNKCIINNKSILEQSIICFLIILTKQNIGLFYFIALSVIILIRKQNGKIIGILQEFGVLTILGIIFIVFLKMNGILEGFVNYTILGMSQFAYKNISIDWIYIFITIAVLLINLISSVSIIKRGKELLKDEDKNNIIILNCFSIMLSIVIFPIVNEAHFLFAINFAVVLLVYILNMIIEKSEIKMNKLDKILTSVLIILLLLNVAINISRFICWKKEVFNSEYIYNYEDPFFGTIIVDEKTKEEINTITNYIEEEDKKGNNVIVFSSKAALYMVPLKKNNGFYDLPFNGNFGNLSEEEILNDLEQKKHTLILVDENDEEDIRWQENKFIIQKIKDEFKCVGHINEFDIYEP